MSSRHTRAVDLLSAGFVHRMHTHAPDPLPLGEVKPKRGRGSAKFTIRAIYICAIRPCPSLTVDSSRCVWSIIARPLRRSEMSVRTGGAVRRLFAPFSRHICAQLTCFSVAPSFCRKRLKSDSKLRSRCFRLLALQSRDMKQIEVLSRISSLRCNINPVLQ